jgi:hypothetical protein
MKPVSLLALALIVPALFAPQTAEARRDGGYMDILTAEAAGEFNAQRYDVYQVRGEHERFVGTTDVKRGSFLGGGFGVRLIYGMKNGLRISGETSYQGGRLIGGDLRFGDASMMMRAELLSGVGYQLVTGPLVWHAAGILGCDYVSFKVAQPIGGLSQGLTPGASPPAAIGLGDELRLTRWGLRAGAQVGVHVQVAKMVALYGDGTFDYDGQWRARFGFAIGRMER